MISVIVPVFQAERCISECIESVLYQTYKEFELILIDDGSTDRSGVICDKYKTLDNRVSVIHKENGGVSSARNAGLEIAKGEYIEFLDSDDKLELNTFEILINIMKTGNWDMIIFGHKMYKNGNYSYSKGIDKEYISKNELFRDFSAIYNESFFNPPWNKLFKRKLIENIKLRFDKELSINYLCIIEGEIV